MSNVLIYKNYKFNDSGIFKTKQKIDKLLFLSSNLDSDIVNRMHYRPEYRSHLKTEMDFVAIYTMESIARNVKTKDFYFISKERTHLANLYNYKNDVFNFTQIIDNFIYNYKEMQEKLQNKKELYKHIKIPKRKIVDGKQQYRHLHEPVPELKQLQTQAKFIIENVLKLVPHNAAHAYFKNRDNVTNAEQHRYSKHVVNIDLKDFFPSITSTLIHESLISFKEFMLLQLNEEKIKTVRNESVINDVTSLYHLQKKLLHAIIDIATYEDSLPQGSPLSPLISNLIMFRFDHHMQNVLLKSPDTFSESSVIYTRYADDLTFSSMYPINLENILERINKYLLRYAPGLKVNENKIKYLKTTRRCYVTGVKLNKDKQVTYGHEKKAELKRELFKLFIMFQENNKDTKEAQETIGRISYLRRIEPKYADLMVDKYCKKFKVPTKNFYQYFLN